MNKRDDKENNNRRNSKVVDNDGFDKKLVEVRRVVKVVKGGKTLKFSALVVTGNRKGQIGFGLGKASEVSIAVEKASLSSKKNLTTISIVNGTIPHEVIGKFGPTSIVMMPSKEGTGIIAGGAARAILELSGIKDITTKIHGARNKINCVKACLDGLNQMKTIEQVAALRGKSVQDL
jgi:small subunit ribosomal protein S5